MLYSELVSNYIGFVERPRRYKKIYKARFSGTNYKKLKLKQKQRFCKFYINFLKII